MIILAVDVILKVKEGGKVIVVIVQLNGRIKAPNSMIRPLIVALNAFLQRFF